MAAAAAKTVGKPKAWATKASVRPKVSRRAAISSGLTAAAQAAVRRSSRSIHSRSSSSSPAPCPPLPGPWGAELMRAASPVRRPDREGQRRPGRPRGDPGHAEHGRGGHPGGCVLGRGSRQLSSELRAADLLVELIEPRQAVAEREALTDPLTSGGTELGSPRRIAQQADHCCGHGRWILGGDDHSGVPRRLAHPADVGRHGRHP